MGTAQWNQQLDSARAAARADAAAQAAAAQAAAAQAATRMANTAREVATLPAFARWYTQHAAEAGLPAQRERSPRRWGPDRRLSGWWASVPTDWDEEFQRWYHRDVFVTATGDLYDRAVGRRTGPVHPVTGIGQPGANSTLRVPAIQQALIENLARHR